MFRKKKVGLALGGGAARGMAHIGVLEVLQQEGIPIDVIAGTSAGALVGAIYAQGKDVSLIENVVTTLDRRQVVSLLDLTLPRTGFIEGRKANNRLRQLIGGDIKFADLKVPLATVATDILTGEEVVIKEGSVLEAVRASISIPVIFTLFKWKGRHLTDGSLVNPVPVSVVREMGADLIIAVNVIPEIAERAQHLAKDEKSRTPNIFTIMMQSIYIGTEALIRASLEGADLIIKPQVAHIHPHEFSRAKECITQGRLAAEAAIPEIKRLLKRWRRKKRC